MTMQAFTLLLAVAMQPTAGLGPAIVGGTPGSPAAGAIRAHTGGDPDAVICHADVTTGRLIHSRTCHTRAEWDRMETDAKAYVDRATRAQSGYLGQYGPS